MLQRTFPSSTFHLLCVIRPLGYKTDFCIPFEPMSGWTRVLNTKAMRSLLAFDVLLED